MDLIDRQAAIDAIYHHLPSVSRMEVRLMLHEVPSAQSETHDKRTETHACDLISRQAAIDEVKKEMLERDGRFYKGLLVANHVILHLPPAQPQRKTGKWKWVNDSDGCIDEVECDQCGDLEIYKSNYCPNCGARMDGESDDQ